MLTQLLGGLWHEKPQLHASSPRVVRRIAKASRARGDLAFLVLAPEATPVADPTAGVRGRLGRVGGGQDALGYVDTDLLRCALASDSPRPR